MRTQPFHDEAGMYGMDEADRAELLRNVLSLRQDLKAVTANVREVIGENTKLKEEIERLRDFRERPSANARGASKAKAFKEEIDQLLGVYDMVSSRSTRTRRAEPSEHSHGNDSFNNSSWMKKMMMFMLLAEVV